MLSRKDVLRMIATGEPLPQEKHPEISEETAFGIQDAKPDLVELAFESAAETDSSVSMAGAIFRKVRELADKHGWYATSVILCISLSGHYTSDQVPDLKGLTPETAELLRSFSRAARTDTGTGSEWTIPVAMLGSLDEDKALEVTSCAVFCAGFGIAMEGVQ